MKLKIGDEVKIMLGKDKGKQGKIEKVFPKAGSVLVTGVNLYKRHKKPAGRTMQGGIIDITKPVLASSVAIVCPKCKLTTKVEYKLGKQSKTRICKKCSQPFE